MGLRFLLSPANMIPKMAHHLPPPPRYNGLRLSGANPSQAAAATAESVKSRMPAVEYQSFVKRDSCGGGVGEPAAACAVCLKPLEPRDEVRDLGSCRHPFHVVCIDRWIDMGRLSCPLCRALLLPAAHRRSSSAAGPLALLKLLVTRPNAVYSI
ncbi:E3 ubiquitin-protein ligase RHA1B [Apostasia shenzhenica]|uniref:E3 ubiquitin-protein ligase RHA1B n=1 Tax=Apostasia shenzhenica TaxID=1088818 RepID=A0A2I0AXB3_9ASPA|nr:E3 ubiquitin-protein ligase RHA1B [Apostasia shenzhenica]